VLVDEAQAFTLSGREQADGIRDRRRARGHLDHSKRPQALRVQFSAPTALPWGMLTLGKELAMEQVVQNRHAALELSIGARMRARRRQLGLSQSDLADRLGVSFQQVQKYERGANRVAASTLVAAAEALSTTVAWLVGEETRAGLEDDELFVALSRPGAIEMLRAFNAVPDTRSRSALLTLAQEMSQARE
jgi:transcriptional regulator with XRE-family HTH domain